MPSSRRILVIAGGGAKGAYAFGCMKALRDREEQFDCVAGASAEALNAVIWSTGCFEKGERLWKDMSFQTVYPFRMFDAARYPRFLILGLCSAYLLVRLIWSAIRGVDTPLWRLWIGLFILASSITITVSLTGLGVVWKHHPSLM
jgi:predicted acylesterase/phospholipase RssA